MILMEIDPAQQKTLPDFLLTEEMLGVPSVDIVDIKKEGSHLYYERAGKRIPIHRIYNRAIVDELQRKECEAQFRLARRSRRGMGRTSQLVFPHQQIFNSLSEAPLGAENMVSRSNWPKFPPISRTMR